MQVKSLAVTDYSTGTQYVYSDTSGSWQSIRAVGGTVNSGGGSGASPAGSAAPAITSTSNSAPMPFEGTHRDSSSTYITPNVYPWVAGATTLQTSASSATALAGLPSGWVVTSSGKVVPPSAASVSEPPIFMLWLALLRRVGVLTCDNSQRPHPFPLYRHCLLRRRTQQRLVAMRRSPVSTSRAFPPSLSNLSGVLRCLGATINKASLSLRSLRRRRQRHPLRQPTKPPIAHRVRGWSFIGPPLPAERATKPLLGV